MRSIWRRGLSWTNSRGFRMTDVIFEVPDQNGRLESQVVYARQIDDAVECVYFQRDKGRRADGPTSSCTPGSRNQGLPRSK